MKDIILKIFDYRDIRCLVKEDFQWVNSNREKMEKEKEKYPPGPLGAVVSVIITRGYWRRRFLDEVVSRLKSSRIKGNDEIKVELETKERETLIVTYDVLLKVVEKIANEKKKLWSEIHDSLRNFYDKLVEAGSLKNWVEELYKSVDKGRREEYVKGIKGLGKKAVDIILRDLGYFERAPIDRHERRFLLRTGIALLYTSGEKDPLDYEFYHEALSKYCEQELKGVTRNVDGITIPLDKPGIVDWIIWYFSCEKEAEKKCKAICTSKPKCNECPIKDLCLYRNRDKLKTFLESL